MSEHSFDKIELEKILKGIKGKTLGEVDVNNVFKRTKKNPKITGIAGDVIEQSVLGYPPDTKQAPDLNVSGVPTELKTTGIKVSKKIPNKYEAKEPLSVTAVSPNKIVNETFETSAFWDKIEHMLFVYYLYDSNKTVKASDYANFPIIGYQFHEFDEEDIKVLKHDWLVIRNFIKKVKTDRLNINVEYPKISKLRNQCLMIDTAPKYPNNPRFRLKRTVVSNIYQKKYGDSLEELPKEYVSYRDLDKECHELTKTLKNMTIEELALSPELNVKGNLNSKSICEQITIRMFGGKSKHFNQVDIFNKFGIIGKTIVINKKGAPTEMMKLFLIDFEEIMDETISFENSSFRDYFAQHQFLCTIFEEAYRNSPLKKNKFIGFKRLSFSDDFIDENVKPVWENIRKLVNNNELIDEIQKDKKGEPKINKTGVVSSSPNFPKQKDGVVFVRGSSQNSNSKSLNINGIDMYPQYIWINSRYIISELSKKKYI